MVWQTHSLAPSGQDHGFQTGRGLATERSVKSEIVIEGEALVKVRAFSDQVAYPEFLKRFRHSVGV